MKDILSEIKSPADVRVLTTPEMYELSNEIRDFLIDSVSKTGGHLASNLGVVELTLSLFSEFNLDKDKIIWDVGHQTYIHKILTGRKDRFKELRKHNGMSGFPKRNESVYDFFDTGHSSTSISAALGFARARDLKNEDNNVVAVIGDGALTGGMALEALNDLGFKKTKMIVILNDNQMSISTNVGGLSSYLNKVRMEPEYNKFKKGINNKLNNSSAGKRIAKKLSKIKDSIKQLVVPSMLFEDMGLKYLGPIDGHNIEAMKNVLSKAKNIDEPVIIHVVTQKGKGYELAEKSPDKYHGVSPFNLENGEPINTARCNYSKVFGNALMKLAEKDENIVAITAAMPDGTGLKGFMGKYPERFFDVGIAEQHAVTLSAGMACSGLRPVFAVYSTFLQRAFDQVLHDVCIQNLPVVFAIDRAGLVGEDGETHQGIFDISYLSIIPNITIVTPKCLDEVEPLLAWALKQERPIAIRYPRGGDIIPELKALEKIEFAKWEVLDEGKDSKCAIISTGRMTQHSILAKEILNKEGIYPKLINATFIKPLDEGIIKKLSNEGYDIITVEDNVIKGGLGSNILLSLNNYGFKGTFKALGYNDEFVEQGDTTILYSEWNLDPKGIRDEVLKLLKTRR
ncbi:1-deoxy-D-xylulose-5-phosphate synthase [Clostridium sardiniense]|uniref:1-deoxy-D-xylulose-5-phosphate synthase n=1 Tax=Clostridium sardiniense TaxID=29369 RepID=A0ABS7KVI6_CLOSR|nr:1-deoxy-D-xylulose-5-phosphate synthase [Clostridium sardiniense]MBY0754824.1 1-deoxy-D-xylulose-5-phosphate synthase [Clostridium sardiniense]MDQ0462008.1 1-deoxy-D-xylulose-5-phosphate synthase [Clostridium sardiniense]